MKALDFLLKMRADNVTIHMITPTRKSDKGDGFKRMLLSDFLELFKEVNYSSKVPPREIMRDFLKTELKKGNLRVQDQKALEVDFMNYMDKYFEDQNDFEKAAAPLMRYLADNHHPHNWVMVCSNKAELMESQRMTRNDYFLDFDK